jgi:aspartyl-tRNA(Asn)/glutamyl-tRNA(Gln) amidotransferase subunit C
MEVTDALIDRLARLARLRFSPEEKEAIREDLQRMIHFVDQLQEVDTTNVPPLLHVSETVNVLRKDENTTVLDRNTALKNAQEHDSQYFRVPKAIRKPQES